MVQGFFIDIFCSKRYDYNMRKILTYNTTTKSQIIPITNDIKKVVLKSKVKNGSLYLYSLHTTLALIIQEASEKNLASDIISSLSQIVSDDIKYKHNCFDHPSGACKLDKGNASSHIRHLLSNQNIVLDIEDGILVLGKWQEIALLELDGPRDNRKIHLKIIKD